MDEPWKHCAIVRQIVMAQAAAMKASSLPGLWTMKTRLYSRKATAKVAMMVKLIVTPRTAAGSAWPESPMIKRACGCECVVVRRRSASALACIV